MAEGIIHIPHQLLDGVSESTFAPPAVLEIELKEYSQQDGVVELNFIDPVLFGGTVGIPMQTTFGMSVLGGLFFEAEGVIGIPYQITESVASVVAPEDIEPPEPIEIELQEYAGQDGVIQLNLETFVVPELQFFLSGGFEIPTIGITGESTFEVIPPAEAIELLLENYTAQEAEIILNFDPQIAGEIRVSWIEMQIPIPGFSIGGNVIIPSQNISGDTTLTDLVFSLSGSVVLPTVQLTAQGVPHDGELFSELRGRVTIPHHQVVSLTPNVSFVAGGSFVIPVQRIIGQSRFATHVIPEIGRINIKVKLPKVIELSVE